jgi:hypothetical protein
VKYNPSNFCYNGGTCECDNDGNPMCDCSAAHIIKSPTPVQAVRRRPQPAVCLAFLTTKIQRMPSVPTIIGASIIPRPDTMTVCVMCVRTVGPAICANNIPVPVCDSPCKNGGLCCFGKKGYNDMCHDRPPQPQPADTLSRDLRKRYS